MTWYLFRWMIPNLGGPEILLRLPRGTMLSRVCVHDLQEGLGDFK